MRFAATVLAGACLAAGSTAFGAIDLTIYDWENDNHLFRVGQGASDPLVSVQNTDPFGITKGSYSAEATTTGTTTFYRSVYSTDLADLLAGNSVVKVDFAVKNPNANTTVNVFFYIGLAWHPTSNPSAFFSAESAGTRSQKGTETFNFASVAPDIANGDAFDVRVQLKAVRQNGFTGSVYFDNFRVETIPEPASLGLLSLGAMALGRRRRA